MNKDATFQALRHLPRRLLVRVLELRGPRLRLHLLDPTSESDQERVGGFRPLRSGPWGSRKGRSMGGDQVPLPASEGGWSSSVGGMKLFLRSNRSWTYAEGTLKTGGPSAGSRALSKKSDVP